MRHRSPRAFLALSSVVAVIALIAGCGGDDTPAAPEAATVTGQTTTAAAPAEVPGDAIPAPTDAEIDEAVRIYQEVFGFTEDQARCILTKAAELSGDGAADLAAVDPGTGERILRECGIDPADVSSQLGGTP